MNPILTAFLGKLVYKVVEKKITQRRNAMKQGFKTTEFWLTIIVSLWSQFSGSVPDKYAAAIPVIAIGFYGIARGLAKLGAIGGDVGEFLKTR